MVLFPVPFVLTDPKDSVDMPDAIVEMDSLESRLAMLASDPLRGGSAGVGRGVVFDRGGTLGGSAGDCLGLSLTPLG